MVITHRTYTRPSSDIQWHTNYDLEINSSLDITNEFNRLDAESIADNKKVRTRTLVDDLTLVIEVIWFDNADYQAWISNETVISYLAGVKEYFEQINGTIVDKPVNTV